MTPNPKIVFLVIGTAAVMTLIFFLSLTGALTGVLFFASKLTMTDQVAVIFDKVLAAFVTAGMSVMSFFFGVLVNARSSTSQPQEVKVVNEPGKADEQIPVVEQKKIAAVP